MLWLALVLLPFVRAAWCPLDCRCDKFANGAFVIECPGNESVSRLMLRTEPKESVLIQCTPEATSDDFWKLQGLVTGPLPWLSIEQCPLPPTSLKNLTEPFGLTSINVFVFHSLRNLSDTLDSEFLQGLTSLTKLRLISNGLTELPEDLLKDLPQLTSLHIRDNYLNSIPKKFFNHVPNLKSLELGYNRLTSLEPGIFDGLSKLKLLNLWSNKFQQLDSGVFANLSSLESLDLHSNDLLSLPEDIFAPLVNLSNVNLFGNNFSTLPERLFFHTPNLKILRLFSNQRNLTLPGKLFSGLTELREVYLMKNGLSQLPEDLFANSTRILNISLSGNLLRVLPTGLFAQLADLEVLDLSRNDLKVLPDGLFKGLSKLKTLRLDRNKITEIARDTFLGLVSLTNLNIERNDLVKINSLAFSDLNKLRTANFAFNQLTSEQLLAYELHSPFHSCSELEVLNLANNSLTEIAEDWRFILLKLRTLDLTYNKISSVQITDLQFLAHSPSIDLRYNRISNINLNHFFVLISEPVKNGPIARIKLSSNPLTCDCHAFELSQYANHQLPDALYGTIDLQMDELRCAGPEMLKNRSFVEIHPMELTCAFSENCPEKCDCAYRSADKGLIVNCSSRGLTQIPEELPAIVRSNHTELAVEDNLLQFLPNATPRGYDRVTQLYLSGNHLTYLPAVFLNPNLEVLTMDHNNFSMVEANTVNILGNASRLRLITLHGNPWSCNCDALNFASLLRRRFKQVSFLNDVVCSDGRSIIKLSPAELCPTPLGILIFCISAAIVGVLIGVIAALYYRYHYGIRVWMYAHRCCLWLVTEEELDKDKKYDAFVSFSQKDEQFVIEELVPRLEASGASLCLHYRDWIAGEWIPAQIARSVESSRRTLVILSPNFLDSVWGRLEFRAAHKQALSEGRARVVMILYGNLPPMDQLDPELKAYISVNTYVKWGDPWFWDKLRYALPHAQLKKRKKDDKLELIRTVATPTTEPTTPPVLSIPSVFVGKEYDSSVVC